MMSLCLFIPSRKLYPFLYLYMYRYVFFQKGIIFLCQVIDCNFLHDLMSVCYIVINCHFDLMNCTENM